MNYLPFVGKVVETYEKAVFREQEKARGNNRGKNLREKKRCLLKKRKKMKYIFSPMHPLLVEVCIPNSISNMYLFKLFQSVHFIPIYFFVTVSYIIWFHRGNKFYNKIVSHCSLISLLPLLAESKKSREKIIE